MPNEWGDIEVNEWGDAPAVAVEPPKTFMDKAGDAVNSFFGRGDPKRPTIANPGREIGQQMLKAGAFLVPGSGAASLLGSGALFGAGTSDAHDLGGVVKDTAEGAAGSLVGGKAIQGVGKLLKPVAGAVGEKLASAAERAAVRSTNADRTAYRQAFGKPARLEKVQATGRYLLDNGVPLRTPAAMQEGLSDLISTNGKAIGDLASKASQSGAVADLEGAALRALQHPDVAGLAANTETRAAGDRVVAFIDDQLKQHGNKVTPEVIWNIRRQLDPLSKWSKDTPEALTRGFRALRSSLDEELGAAMGNAGLGSEWAAANKGFALSKTAKKLADVGAERRAGNRLGSPSEKGAAVAGGVAAAVGNPVAGLLIPAGAVAANRAAMPAAAHTFDWAASLARAMSGAGPAPANLVAPAAAESSLVPYLINAMKTRLGQPGLVPVLADEESAR